MGFFFQKEGIAIPQLYLGKGEDQLLRGREALPVEFNLQMTATKSFRVTFGVRLWAEAAQAVFFVAALWEAAAVGTVLQPLASKEGTFPTRAGLCSLDSVSSEMGKAKYFILWRCSC